MALADFTFAFCQGKTICTAKNPKIKSIRIYNDGGARPRWSPKGDLLVFDQKNPKGYFALHTMDKTFGHEQNLTFEKPNLRKRNSGNGIFDPSGKYIVFIAEDSNPFLQRLEWSEGPKVGLFSNLWATDIKGTNLWPLTHFSYKKDSLGRKNSIIGMKNPLFSPDGKTLLWSQRYVEKTLSAKEAKCWGKWRIMAMDFNIKDSIPQGKNERVFFQPIDGNYVTAMGFLNPDEIIVAGSLEGQHEYGMDLYRYNVKEKSLKNLTNTPEFWEEEAAVTPKGHIIFMSNSASKYHFNFKETDWTKQIMEKDYFLMDQDGLHKEQLTFFNDPYSPEYLGERVMTLASDMSPDGLSLAATLAVDLGATKGADFQLVLALIEFKEPL